MNNRNSAGRMPRSDVSSWQSRVGIALIIFMAIGGLLLVYEHRLHLLTGNTFIIALLAVCVGVHFFLHRGHHGGSKHGDET